MKSLFLGGKVYSWGGKFILGGKVYSWGEVYSWGGKFILGGRRGDLKAINITVYKKKGEKQAQSMHTLRSVHNMALAKCCVNIVMSSTEVQAILRPP